MYCFKQFPITLALVSLFIISVICPAARASDLGEKENRKVAVVLKTGPKAGDGFTRAEHQLAYAQDLKNNRREVVFIFHGEGQDWHREWSNPKSSSKLKKTYDKLVRSGVEKKVCDCDLDKFKAEGYQIEAL